MNAPVPPPKTAPAPRRPAVFLDRDGTLVRDLRHGAEPALMRLLPGVVPALRALDRAGYALVVVTNQSGVARGLFSADESLAMGRRLAALVAAAGLRLAGYHLAPEAPESMPSRDDHTGIANPPTGSSIKTPAFRKPSPRMLLEAAAALDLDLSRSWMVGDALSDLQAGLAAGARAILLDTGALAYPDEAALPAILRDPQVHIARNLAHAAALMLAQHAAGDSAEPSSEQSATQSTQHSAEDGTQDDFEVDGLPPDLQITLPPQVLLREHRPADLRGPGEPSPWPDSARIEAAAVDGLRLGNGTTSPSSPGPIAPSPGAEVG
jgi:histidinol-phosphate phosphatase family protein